MNAETFAEWLQRQGYKVVRSPCSFWYEASPRVYQAFPYHWIIDPPEAELQSLLKNNKALALRYSSPAESPEGCISYHAVYTQPEYTLDHLDRRTRQNVRRGLSNCRVLPIPFEQLAEEGWILEADTTERQRRQTEWNQAAWRRRCLSAADLPGFEAWGAFRENKLVASLLLVQIDDWVEYISQQCLQECLNDRVNNALCFSVTQKVVSRQEIQGVFYTLQSLDAPASIDEFKFRMGFTARLVRQRVVFHPWLAPLANSLSHQLLVRLRRRNPASRFLAKAEGVFRFYRSGKLPVAQQEWPEILADQQEEFLESPPP
jgi:hypothetical protein